MNQTHPSWKMLCVAQLQGQKHLWVSQGIEQVHVCRPFATVNLECWQNGLRGKLWYMKRIPLTWIPWGEFTLENLGQTKGVIVFSNISNRSSNKKHMVFTVEWRVPEFAHKMPRHQREKKISMWPAKMTTRTVSIANTNKDENYQIVFLKNIVAWVTNEITLKYPSNYPSKANYQPFGHRSTGARAVETFPAMAVMQQSWILKCRRMAVIIMFFKYILIQQ